MTDYTKYVPYFLRSLRHRVQPVGWQPDGSRHRSSTKFLDVSGEPSLKKKLLDKSRSGAFPVDMAKAFNIIEGDLVRVLYGRDAGSSGIVRCVLPSSNQVIVSNCNVIKSFRPCDAVKQINRNAAALIPMEAPIHVTNVVPLDPVVKKPTRIKRRYTMSGECVRISKLTGCAMPEPTVEINTSGDSVSQRKHNLKANFVPGSPVSQRSLDSWNNDGIHFHNLGRFSKL